MTRVMVGGGLALLLVLGLGASVPAQAQTDVPLSVTFAGAKASPTACSDGMAWCADVLNKAYVSQGKNLVAEIANYDFADYDPVGGFRFEVSSASGRSVMFDFTRRIDTDAAWCPEVCPDDPADVLPNFVADPIKAVSLFDMPAWSGPNYGFWTDSCDTVRMADGCCANDVLIFLYTARKEYRLRFSPNIWRELTEFDDIPGDTLPYGVVGVQQIDAATWKIAPLMEHPLVMVGSVPVTEPCPAALERKDVNKGRNTWVFLGCYDMPFELTLTKRQ